MKKRVQKASTSVAGETSRNTIDARGATDPVEIQAEVVESAADAVVETSNAEELASLELPSVYPLVIDGKVYRMAMGYNDLATAEAALRKQGLQVNLLLAMCGLNLWSIRVLFAASLYRFHPEIAFEDAKALLGLAHVTRVAQFICAELDRSAGLASLPGQSDAAMALAAGVAAAAHGTAGNAKLVKAKLRKVPA